MTAGWANDGTDTDVAVGVPMSNHPTEEIIMLVNLLYAAAFVLAFLAVLALLGVIVIGAGWVALAIAAVICGVVGYILANGAGRRV